MVRAAGSPTQLALDLWALFLVAEGVAQYQTPPATRACAAVERCLRRLDRHIDRAPLFNWGQFRWFEALIAILLADTST